MYQKYQTEALILGSRERGESDKIFALYTRDFGLVWARATGVRKEASRTRFALQNGAYIQTGLIRGKKGWRITGPVCVGYLAGASRGAPTFARISALVLRLVHGEEENRYLFEALAEGHAALSASNENGPTIEIVCVARVLYSLGYLSAGALGSALFTHTAYGAEHIVEAEEKRVALLSSINKAIAETQL